MHGQLSLAATCSIWVDLPVPWYPCISTLLLEEKPASIESVVAGSNIYVWSISGTCSVFSLSVYTC